MSDTNKVVDFLIKIDFTWDEIQKFYEQDHDSIDKDGNKSYGPDCLYAITKAEEDWVELDNTGELIEDYWNKGWFTRFAQFQRTNFDSYKGHYYKAFPTRYRLPAFNFTKSLRRVLNINRDLKTVIRPLRITPAKSNLRDIHHFLRYGKPPEKPLTENYKYIVHHPAKLMELCIFKDEKLVACSIFEEGNFALNSNVAFWDLNEKSRSLGILTVLLEIKYALARGYFYYFLGNFYAQNPNYHYKTRFPGLELFDWETELWIDFTWRERIKEMLLQKLPRHKD